MAATFSGIVSFASVTFSGKAQFNGATFTWVKFDGRATFEKDVFFDGASFRGETDFKNAIFAAQSTFVNAKMKYDTSFEGATFKEAPPHFFGAKLHQGTVWRGIKPWPLPKDEKDAGAFIDAYACLKLEMDRLKKHEDELDFFALELQSRRVLLGRWWGLPICLYGVLSDYGRSYGWPLFWLSVVVVFWGAIFRHFGAFPIGEAFGLSFANTLNLFGFRKDFFP